MSARTGQCQGGVMVRVRLRVKVDHGDTGHITRARVGLVGLDWVPRVGEAWIVGVAWISSVAAWVVVLTSGWRLIAGIKEGGGGWIVTALFILPWFLLLIRRKITLK